MSDLNLIPPVPDSWPHDRDPKTDYMDFVVDAIINHPRSLQRSIGPSEIGTPCTRKLGYKLAGHEERTQPPNWRATIGTGGHLWQETCFDRANMQWALSQGTPGIERYLIEETVTVGLDAAGKPITGSCDLFDRLTGTVIDHKFVGKTQLAKYTASGPSQTYRVQAHLYGQGWVNAGVPVERVMIAFLPRDGQLDDACLWSEPWDRQIAANALQRLHGVQLTLQALGDSAFENLPTADDYCISCPFYHPGATDAAIAWCPGDDSVKPYQPTLTLSV